MFVYICHIRLLFVVYRILTVCVYILSAVFAYHFMPIPIYHHDHHYYHYYSGSNSGSATPNRVYYDYRNTTESTAHQPILYNYKTPEVNHSLSDSSSEEEKPIELLNSVDYVIAGISAFGIVQSQS